MSKEEIQKKIAPTLKKYGIRRASVFGSVARGESGPDSDVDILVSIGTPMGMITYMRMVEELEERLGRKVDVVTESGLNKHLKPYIEKDMQSVYEG